VSDKPDYHLTTHPSVLDGFVQKFREIEKEALQTSKSELARKVEKFSESNQKAKGNEL
jgi:uncharacterized protein (DUF362 family)